MDGSTIASLFPPEVVVECARIEEVEGELAGAERLLIERAAPRRAREILAGRVLARRALARLGIEGHELLREEGRAPLWPRGVLGSISHTRERCAVAVARAGPILGIGLDIEEGRDLPERLLPYVCTEPERRWIESALLDPRELGRLFFSAKESVYKCQYPLRRRWLGFRDVELTLAEGRYEARATATLEALWPEGTLFEGRFFSSAEGVVCAAVLLEGDRGR